MKNLEKLIHKYLDLKFGNIELTPNGDEKHRSNEFIIDSDYRCFFDGYIMYEIQTFFNLPKIQDTLPYIKSWIEKKFNIAIKEMF